jgi:hypothetical protein
MDAAAGLAASTGFTAAAAVAGGGSMASSSAVVSEPAGAGTMIVADARAERPPETRATFAGCMVASAGAEEKAGMMFSSSLSSLSLATAVAGLTAAVAGARAGEAGDAIGRK